MNDECHCSANREIYLYNDRANAIRGTFKIESLPKAYYPNSDNYFELSDGNNIDKIKSLIISSLSKQ